MKYLRYTCHGNQMCIRDSQNTMLELATYFQRGLHSGLDVIMDPDFQSYDSLLTLSLQERGISLPYRIEYLHFSNTPDSSLLFTDTLGIDVYKRQVLNAV